MANPVPYQQLFDIDGLNAAITECEGTADQFSAAVTEDFKRINTSVQAIRKSIEALNVSMGQRTIKLVDETSQQAIVDYAKQVVELTKQVRDQQSAITNLNEIINANKVAVSDAKVAAANFATEQQNLKAQQEATKLAIVQQTLSLEQQKQALTDSKLAAQQAVTAQQNSKSAISAANLANQQYITTIKQNQAAQAALNTQIAQNRVQISNLALANKQAAQAQTAATGSYNEASARLKVLGNDIKNAKDGFTSTDSAIKAQIKSYNDLNDKLKAFDASMGNHQRNVGNYKSVLGNLQGELEAYASNLFTLAAAMELVNKTFDLALSTDATRTSLGYILGNTELADIKLRALKKTANDLGLEFVSTAKAYALFIGAAKASNFSLTEADKIFNSVARASGILHLSADQTSNAFYALQEMISKGTIQSKELQRQLGQAIPGAVQIMADAVGVSVQKLHDMERSGELLTKDILPKFAEQLDKTFAPGITKVDSLQASVNNLKNTFSELIDEQSQIGGFFKFLLNVINDNTKAATGLVSALTNGNFRELMQRLKWGGNAGKEEGSADMMHELQQGRDNTFKVSTQADPFLATGGTGPIDKVRTRVNALQIALDEARSTYMGLLASVEKGQLTEGGDLTFKKLKQTYDTLQATLNLYKTEYPKAFENTQKTQAELTDEQLTSVEQIRKRITELSKLPGSATPGSDIANRIEELKRRLHDLAPSYKAAKDGFAILEEQIKKTMLALQDSIIQDYAKHQGKESENTKKLADAYENLATKLIALQKLRDDALLKSKQAGFIKTFGSLYPINNRVDKSPNTNIDPTKIGKDTILGNELQIGQDNIDIADLEKELNKVVLAHTKANIKILNAYKSRNITKTQYDAESLAEDSDYTDKEYYLNTASLSKQLEIARLTYGEESKQYAALLLKKAQLDEAYGRKSLADLLKQEENKRKIIQETIDTLEKSSAALSSGTGNSGLGKILNDFSRVAVNAFTKDGSGNLAGLSTQDAIKEGANVAIDATAAYTDFAINASKQRQAALEMEMQYEITGAGNNAVAKRAIEAEYTNRIRAEKTKQAKLAKEAAEIEIIVNTAVAASKVFGQTGIFGIGLAPIIIGLGLAELALVAAQPIPQFERGRESGPATIAEVNERGPEALVKNGKVRFANKGKRGYTFLEKDERVIPAHKTDQMFLDRQIENGSLNAEAVGKSKMIYDSYMMNISRSDINYEEIGNQMKKAVNDLPYQVANFDEKGVTKFIRTKNAKIMQVRNRNQF
jgi:tape measure domain-containing protein